MDTDDINKATRHLRRVDSTMAQLVRAYRPHVLARRKTNPFHGLVSTIINQQLSIAAGRTIVKRLLDAQGGRVLRAEKLANLTSATLRRCGISKRKVDYIQNMTLAVRSGELNFKRLERLDNEAIVELLMGFPGIGRWSAEIFLITTLQRTDVLPIGDLVLRRAIKHYYGLPIDSLESEYLKLSAPWRPYRTVASRFLWAAS